jgi:hypothetical protein
LWILYSFKDDQAGFVLPGHILLIIFIFNGIIRRQGNSLVSPGKPEIARDVLVITGGLDDSVNVSVKVERQMRMNRVWNNGYDSMDLRLRVCDWQISWDSPACGAPSHRTAI